MLRSKPKKGGSGENALLTQVEKIVFLFSLMQSRYIYTNALLKFFYTSIFGAARYVQSIHVIW